MRMIRWIRGHTQLNRIRNVVIRETVRVAPIGDKMREGRLIGHIKRRNTNCSVRRCERIDLSKCKKDIGGSKKIWNEVIRQDMIAWRHDSG